VGKVSKAKKKKSRWGGRGENKVTKNKKIMGRGPGENKVAKKQKLRSGLRKGKQKKSEAGMAQG
jgi:hypothetical protein